MCNISLYLPWDSMSDGLEDWHCLLCLADPSGTWTVLTTRPWLCMRSHVKQFLFTTNNPDHEPRNKITHNCESSIPILRILRVNQIHVNWRAITRTLRNIEFPNVWHSIWVSPLATDKNESPRSKTANYFARSAFCLGKSACRWQKQTSKPRINRVLQDAPTY